MKPSAIKGEIPTIYHGIRAIAQRLQIGIPTVYRWYWKRNLPMIQTSCARKYSRSGWMWYSDETLIAAWWISQLEHQRKVKLARHASARAATVRERCIKRGRPIPDEHKLPQDK